MAYLSGIYVSESSGLVFKGALVWSTCLVYIYVSGSSGMAYLSGMCSTEASCTIAEARSLGSTALISKLGSRNC